MPAAARGCGQCRVAEVELGQLKQREAELLAKLEAQNSTLDQLLLLSA